MSQGVSIQLRYAPAPSAWLMSNASYSELVSCRGTKEARDAIIHSSIDILELLPHLQECELGLLERGQPSQEINLRKLVVSHVHLQLPPPGN